MLDFARHFLLWFRFGFYFRLDRPGYQSILIVYCNLESEMDTNRPTDWEYSVVVGVGRGYYTSICYRFFMCLSTFMSVANLTDIALARLLLPRFRTNFRYAHFSLSGSLFVRKWSGKMVYFGFYFCNMNVWLWKVCICFMGTPSRPCAVLYPFQGGHAKNVWPSDNFEYFFSAPLSSLSSSSLLLPLLLLLQFSWTVRTEIFIEYEWLCEREQHSFEQTLASGPFV